MLAKLHVFTPFSLTIPKGEQFPLYEYEDRGYRVWVYPPAQSELLKSQSEAAEIQIDDMPTYQADVLQIIFQRDSFTRIANEPCDPPIDVMDGAINSFLVRLRYVARASDLRPLKLSELTWHVQYLNDDETELGICEGEIRGRGSRRHAIGCIALTKEVWNDIHTLPENFQPPPWDELLLDAVAELPRVGTAIVLAATALEVFIAYVLDRMTPYSEVPEEFWSWANKRSDISRNPTVEEQYDILLSLMTGHSLKEEKELWDSFKHLKTARNTFVHEGVAKLGGAIVESDKARAMIGRTVEIVSKVREWLPEEILWPEYRHKVKLGISMALI